jgi:hypothetical protein
MCRRLHSVTSGTRVVAAFDADAHSYLFHALARNCGLPFNGQRMVQMLWGISKASFPSAGENREQHAKGVALEEMYTVHTTRRSPVDFASSA